ncbi:hypothetical protein GCM10023082_43120 [Streptomyces tremellae]|uniref:HTH araC/xylS-type domain-containing protein n=1 Tax=Streptomyces tremellae TaxID=1124239 RepID=A0ABP7FMX5_9ACTN
MAPRTFARRFQQETGTTPYRWLLRQRVLLAQELLEGTDETVDSVAGRAGFGNAATLRHHFLRVLSTTPHAYRRTLRGADPAGLRQGACPRPSRLSRRAAAGAGGQSFGTVG